MTPAPTLQQRPLSAQYSEAANDMLTDFIAKLRKPLSPLTKQTFISGYQQAIRDGIAWLTVLERAALTLAEREAEKAKGPQIEMRHE